MFSRNKRPPAATAGLFLCCFSPTPDLNPESDPNAILARQPGLLRSFVPLVVLVALLAVNLSYFGSDGTSGSIQMVLLIATGVACALALPLGHTWQSLEEGMFKSVTGSMQAMVILLLIGALTGTWMLSGIVPTLIYYGLDILSPNIFLFAACVICSIISVSTGSSWSTIGTIGVALMGIGQTLGMDTGLVAGAIISGAYFGDKISPMSDTTNLAPAMAGTDLFTHVRYMLITTVPSIVITLIIFLVLGFSATGTANLAEIHAVQQAIGQQFTISAWLLLVPVAVVALILLRVPAIPALAAGVALGAIAALIAQQNLLAAQAGPNGNMYTVTMKSLYTTIRYETGNAVVDNLLASRGMAGMLNTVWLIICAMLFGGAMEASGMLARITRSIVQLTHSAAGLIASTGVSSILINLTASDQYLSIVLPGRMYADTYRDRGLAPENLSRTLEDCGTVTSVLVPWNTCGATQATVLNISTMTYLPYCFFNIISPVMSVLIAVLGYRIRRLAVQDSGSGV